MREIKFRAWDGNIGLMHDDISMFVDYSYNGVVPRNGVVLMQFTGLTDKNGIEIYEGDIVHTTAEFDYHDHSKNRAVEFTKGQFILNGSQLSLAGELSQYDCEAIGNIYENPELLEASHEE